MELENAKRNLRDFLSMYNQFTETCFERCIQNLNYRVLTPQEESCTNKCVSKLINVNHREISTYMEINPLNRRLNELGSDAELTALPPDLAQEVEKALGKDALVAGEAPTPAVRDIAESVGIPTTATAETLSTSTAEAHVDIDSTSQSGAQGSASMSQPEVVESGKT